MATIAVRPQRDRLGNDAASTDRGWMVRAFYIQGVQVMRLVALKRAILSRDKHAPSTKLNI